MALFTTAIFVGAATLSTIGLGIMAEIPVQLQIGATFEQNIPYINEAFQAINDENRTKIISNGSTPTVLFGYQAGGFNGQDYGLKVAKPGVNVTTATPDQLAFSSAFDNLKVVLSGVGSVVVPSAVNTTTTFTVPHGLGYTPIVFVYANYPTSPAGSYAPAPVNVVIYNSTSGYYDVAAQLYAVADNTNLTINVNSATSFTAGTWTFRYYLLQETAN